MADLRGRLLDLIVLAIAVGAMGMGVYNRLPSRVEPPAVITEGDRLPPIKVHSTTVEPSDDARIPSDEAGHISLVYVFQSTCPFCELTAPAWANLAADASNVADVLAVSHENPTTVLNWVTTREIAARPMATVTATDLRQWQVRGVPTTILLSGDSVVMVRTGALTHEDEQAFREALGLNPGRGL